MPVQVKVKSKWGGGGGVGGQLSTSPPNAQLQQVDDILHCNDRTK